MFIFFIHLFYRIAVIGVVKWATSLSIGVKYCMDHSVFFVFLGKFVFHLFYVVHYVIFLLTVFLIVVYLINLLSLICSVCIHVNSWKHGILKFHIVEIVLTNFERLKLK